MADNSILTPGCLTPEINAPVILDTCDCLKKDNYLSEFETEGEKSVVRENLNIPSKDSVYDKTEVDILVASLIRNAILEYLNMEDPHGIIPIIEEKVKNLVKDDGSTPFNAPQSGKDPVLDGHLTTKRFVTRLLKEHLNAEDPHSILPEVLTLLEKYVKTSEIYSKDKLYTKEEINNLSKNHVKNDGTTPFIKTQSGCDPTLDSHLSTKRYVDKTLLKHLVDVDPHGFISILNLRLASYAKKKDYLDKTETYSRTLIDNLLYKLVDEAVESAIQTANDDIAEKFEQIRKLKYVKSDGSVPFTQPLLGVDGVEDTDLITLKLLKESISELLSKDDIKECEWITSGPVETTVGFVEDNSTLPKTMNLLEIMDAIFYGNGIILQVPEYCMVGETVPVTVCVHGSTALIEHAEVYLDGELIDTLLSSNFEDGCVTLTSKPIYLDSKFTFKVFYTTGAMHEESAIVKCSLPLFVGLLPKWKFGNTITMDYLKELVELDVNKTLNQFINVGPNPTSISFKYEFKDSDLRHPFLVVPVHYNDLEDMTTKSQSFGIDAFDIIDIIPLSVDGIDRSVMYKIYIYKQALSSLNLEVTFNFKSDESAQ